MAKKILCLIALGILDLACSVHPQRSPTTIETKMSQLTFISARGNVSFYVEIVQTEPLKKKGLMFRKKLAENTGMLFIFDQEDIHPFWMKNTLISLDIIFLDQQKKVVGIIENTTPLSTELLYVYVPSKYALEVNAGSVQKHHIEKNMQAIF